MDGKIGKSERLIDNPNGHLIGHQVLLQEVLFLESILPIHHPVNNGLPGRLVLIFLLIHATVPILVEAVYFIEGCQLQLFLNGDVLTGLYLGPPSLSFLLHVVVVEGFLEALHSLG